MKAIGVMMDEQLGNEGGVTKFFEEHGDRFRIENGCAVEVDLSSTSAADEHLAHLVLYQDLEILDLSDTKITDDGLKHLQVLDKLKRLLLARDHISSDGLCNLVSLRALQYLDLSSTPIGADSISVLARMTNLEGLDIRGSQFSRAGRRQLKDALPMCNIF